jgi:hypothetical protein
MLDEAVYLLKQDRDRLIDEYRKEFGDGPKESAQALSLRTCAEELQSAIDIVERVTKESVCRK